MAQLIRQEQITHLKFVLDQPEEVLIEFCKLAIEYINSGINEKKCTIAAKKLETTFDTIKSSVEALVCLLIDCTKLQTSEEDFWSLKPAAGFTEGQTAILWQFVNSKRNLVESILSKSSDGELHFRDLEWRLEARIASRSLHKQATPIIAMKLHLDSEQVNEHKEKLAQESEENTGVNTRQEVLLQTDPTSLVHLIQVLEQALVESKTHRVRTFVKSVQKK